MADAELRHAERAAVARGLAVVAWLHSHPSGFAMLSAADRESLVVSRLPWVVANCCDDGTVAYSGYAAATAEPVPILVGP
jgi:proteasome lid subunit RPN8/RPN11